MPPGKLELDGAAGLMKALSELDKKASKKVIRSAMRSAAKPILAQAKANAPVKTGLAKKSLKIRALPRSRNRIGVAVQTKDGDFKGEAFYVSFYEYGSKHQPAQPFMRNSFDTKKGEAAKIAGNMIVQGIEQQAALLASLSAHGVKV